MRTLLETLVASLPADAWAVELALMTLKSSVLLAVAALVMTALRRASAAARHLVLSVAVMGLLMLPLLGLLLPRWQVPLLIPKAGDVSALIQPHAPPATYMASEGAHAPGPAIADTRSLHQEVQRDADESAVAIATGSNATPSATAIPGMHAGTPALSPFSWIVLIWLAGAVLVLGRLGAGVLLLYRFSRSARPITDAQWQLLMSNASGMLGLRRPVQLLRAERTSMPFTWGWLRPVVILPADCENWTPERRRVVLLHELAHVTRHDCLLQISAQFVFALYWFHPGAWWLARQVRQERERACDDRVLSLGTRASEYAHHLLEVARTHHASALAGASALTMARPSQLEGRLLAVLDPARDRRAPGVRATLLIAALATALVSPLAAMLPRPHEDRAQFSALDDPTEGEPAVNEPAPAGRSGDVTNSPIGMMDPHSPAFIQDDTVRRKVSLEELIALRSVGVDRFYIEELRAVGYDDLDNEQLIALGATGVSAQYVAELNALGFDRPTAEQVASLRAVGVTLSFITEFLRRGYDELALSDIEGMRAVGVTGDYIDQMNVLGYGRIPAQRLISLRAVGVNGEYVQELEAHGFTGLSLEQIEGMRAVGVTGDYIATMRATGLDRLDAQTLTGLRAMGVTSAYVRDMGEVGLQGLSTQQLMDLRAHGVTASYVRELADAGFHNLSAQHLVRLRISGIDRDLIRSRQRPPVPPTR